MPSVRSPRARSAPSAPSPVLYERIADDLAARIRSRELAPFAKLPSESELMAGYGVSRVTVRQALRRLAEAGLVISRQGKGVFVAGAVVSQELSTLRGFYDSLVLQGHDPKATVVSFEHHRPKFSAGDLASFEYDVYRFRRLYCLGDMPIAVADVTLPGAGREVAREDVERFPVYALLKHVVKREVARASVQVRAARGEAGIAKLLNVAPGATILQMERTSFDPKGLAVETTVFHIPPEVFAFQLEVSGPLQIASSIKRIDPTAGSPRPKTRKPGGKQR